MALRLMDFVSENQVEEEKELFNSGPRVQDRLGPNEKPLFEILKENKDKKDAEFNEKIRHRPPKALDDDETEFLESVEMHARQQEQQRIQEETEQVINFQAALAERIVPTQEPRIFSHLPQENQEAVPRNKRAASSRVLPISVKIMPLPKKSKSEMTVSGVKKAEQEIGVVRNTKRDGTEDQKAADLSESGLLGLRDYGDDSDED